ncbi:hypothetical protein O6H91_13G090800 [Diphasiastrum complanatum]|uniref:Uncharacterized protein n=1 Tax=Diphasiastrum complanatum TaxID=34168 RepID=A0ACC2BY87_DIPCM|nr:hypothetical protein O6H91_13G090800 [Diphasiastrum complanatum]
MAHASLLLLPRACELFVFMPVFAIFYLNHPLSNLISGCLLQQRRFVEWELSTIPCFIDLLNFVEKSKLKLLQNISLIEDKQSGIQSPEKKILVYWIQCF